MLEKMLSLSPDAYIPDLEDSVPLEEKENARNITASFLSSLKNAGPLVIPRVNSKDSGLFEEDLAAVVGPHIFGISVGKINSAEDVHLISTSVQTREKKAGLNVGSIKLVLWLETARAIVNAYQICAASPRVLAVAFGAEDFTNDMGVERTGEDSQIAYPRSVVCVAARAANILALDTPYFQFRDAEGLRRDALTARTYGFRGKFAIHPDQIDVINEAFSPSAREIEDARRVVLAYEQAERSGRGSTSLDGKVIDLPVVERARHVLELASGVACLEGSPGV